MLDPRQKVIAKDRGIAVRVRGMMIRMRRRWEGGGRSRCYLRWQHIGHICCCWLSYASWLWISQSFRVIWWNVRPTGYPLWVFCFVLSPISVHLTDGSVGYQDGFGCWVFCVLTRTCICVTYDQEPEIPHWTILTQIRTNSSEMSSCSYPGFISHCFSKGNRIPGMSIPKFIKCRRGDRIL